MYSRKDNIVEEYHGIKVKDPYRWLEDDYSEETKAWVEEQNRQTYEYIRNVPYFHKVKERLMELWNYPKYSVPKKVGNKYFYFKNQGLQNQPVLYMQSSLEEEPKVVLDPNNFSEDGTVALTNYSFNKEGTLLAYATSRHGSDWQEIRVLDIQSNEKYKEVIQWVKFTDIAWVKDSSGFFYSRFPKPGTVPKEDESNFNSVYWHKLGTPQEDDILVYQELENKEQGYVPTITDDGKYLIITAWVGTSHKSKIYYKEINSDNDFTQLISTMDAKYDFIGSNDTLFYFLTDKQAPNGRLVAIDIKNPKVFIQEIIPEQKDALVNVNINKNYIVATLMQNASHRVKIYHLDGTFIETLALPYIGSITELNTSKEDSGFLFGLTSYLHPANIYSYDIENKSLSLFMESKVSLDTNQYETKQVFYTSKDGTNIPMFLTHKKGLILDGNNPALLYGYGGFNISLTPNFSPSVQVWLENGGVYAVANLRGGSEYGEEWHQAGILDRKQNVFDDFIAAGEWLIKNNYTQQAKLAIMGRSNGGLLVAACIAQRPDLYGAAICGVPVIDMLRYHKFTIGRYWVPEYGNAETNKDHFDFLYAYSPLHNIKEGTAYPPTIIGTADTDDRVVPLHARKFAATMQNAQNGDNPILLRVEKKAGHGLGKPTIKVIEEEADFYTFLFKELEVGII